MEVKSTFKANTVGQLAAVVRRMYRAGISEDAILNPDEGAIVAEGSTPDPRTDLVKAFRGIQRNLGLPVETGMTGVVLWVTSGSVGEESTPCARKDVHGSHTYEYGMKFCGGLRREETDLEVGCMDCRETEEHLPHIWYSVDSEVPYQCSGSTKG